MKQQNSQQNSQAGNGGYKQNIQSDSTGNSHRGMTRKLAESAVLIALGTILSIFKIDMPMGGGLTICSMLPLVLLSFRYGWKWGTFSALAYSLLQLVLGLDNVQYATSFIMAAGVVFLDYVIAYTVIGLSGLAKEFIANKRTALTVGIAVTFALRFLCHFITGIWIWNALWPNEYGMAGPVYSAVYNGWYMGAELVLTVLVANLLYQPLGKYFRGDDLK